MTRRSCAVCGAGDEWLEGRYCPRCLFFGWRCFAGGVLAAGLVGLLAWFFRP